MSSDEIKNRTVYMLCRTDGGTDIYVGSTSQSLPQRLSSHRQRAGGTHPSSNIMGVLNYIKKCVKLESTILKLPRY